MKGYHWLALALALTAIIAVAVALLPLTEAAGERLAPPPSAADLLRERQQEAAPQDGSAFSWFLLVSILSGAFLVSFSRSGAELLRQWRLTRRRPRRQRQPPAELPELPPARELPPWRD